MRSGKAHWKMGVDSHNDLIDINNLDKDNIGRGYCQIEIVPDDYLNMHRPMRRKKDGSLDGWTFRFDDGCPDWWKQKHEQAAWESCEAWYLEVCSIVDFAQVRNPINPLSMGKRNPTEYDKKLLREWASIRVSDGVSVVGSVGDFAWNYVGNSVGNSVMISVWDFVWDFVRDFVMSSAWDFDGGSDWGSVRDFIWDSVWGFVWAYIGSLFVFSRDKWEADKYPFESSVKLWRRGFIPSFDGTTWRLHSGKKAEVVYEFTPKK